MPGVWHYEVPANQEFLGFWKDHNMWLAARLLPWRTDEPVVRIAEVGWSHGLEGPQAVLHNAASDDVIYAIHTQHAVRSGS